MRLRYGERAYNLHVPTFSAVFTLISQSSGFRMVGFRSTVAGWHLMANAFSRDSPTLTATPLNILKMSDSSPTTKSSAVAVAWCLTYQPTLTYDGWVRK